MTEHTHWKKLTNPDYLGSYSLEDGQDLVLTIKTIGREIVTGAEGKKDDCTVAHFVEPAKPMILNNTNCKTIEKTYKTAYIDQWVGKRIQIYVDHNIKVGKEIVDGLRIRPFAPKQAGQAVSNCADCSKQIEPYGLITAAKYAESTLTKFGRPLCYTCSMLADAASKKQADPLGPAPDSQIGMEGTA